MKKKQVIMCISLLIMYCFACSMDPAPIFSYEEFRLTRPYGISKSDFCLPPDIIYNHIRPYIAKALAIKYKHITLKYKDIRRTQRETEGILQIISLGKLHTQTFRNHDGTYTIIPNIASPYAMCDESLNKQRIFIDHPQDKNDSLKQVLYGKNKQQQSIKIYFSEKKHPQKNTNLFIKRHDKDNVIPFHFSSTINHAVLSHNSKWLIVDTLQNNNNIELFNLNTLMRETILVDEGLIGALCSAHHSSKFIACTQNGNILLITPKTSFFLPAVEKQNNQFISHAQFSPNDKQLIAHGSFVLNIWSFVKNNAKKFLGTYKQIETEDIIRKGLFTPDGNTIILAMKNGFFYFYDSETGNHLKSYFPRWRLNGLINFDEKPPLIVCSTHSKLLISLDPLQSLHDRGYTFVIRKASGKFDFLASHNFYPNNPVVMGLTKDEESIVFTDSNNQVYLLNLYDEDDSKCINFIQNTADLFSLCRLLDLYKKLKPNRYNTNIATFINAVHSYAQFHQK